MFPEPVQMKIICPPPPGSGPGLVTQRRHKFVTSNSQQSLRYVVFIHCNQYIVNNFGGKIKSSKWQEQVTKANG